MAQHSYKPGIRSRLRAFFLTDRNGQALASLLGSVAIARWWFGQRFRRPDRT